MYILLIFTLMFSWGLFAWHANTAAMRDKVLIERVTEERLRNAILVDTLERVVPNKWARRDLTWVSMKRCQK